MADLSTYFHFRDVSHNLLAEADIDATVALINDAYSYQDEAKGRPRINAQELRQKIESSEFYVGKQDGREVTLWSYAFSPEELSELPTMPGGIEEKIVSGALTAKSQLSEI